MDHSRTAFKPFLIYREEPHSIKSEPDPLPLGEPFQFAIHPSIFYDRGAVLLRGIES